MSIRTPVRPGSPADRPGGLAAALRAPELVDSTLILATSVLMAAAGAGFWLIGARLHDAAAVGIAGSLVSATVVISFAAQLGLNVTLVDTMPTSARRAADFVTTTLITGSTGFVLGLGYALVAPLVVPQLEVLRASPVHALSFAALCAGTAVNVTTDSAFLALRMLGANLGVNGVLMGVVKCGLPFALIGLGAFGLYAAVGVASLVAAVASCVLVLRALPRPWLAAPSEGLRRSVRYSLSGYAVGLVDLAPVLVLPLIILGALGAEANAVYFVGFQIVTLLNSVAFAVGSSTFAAGAREPHRAWEIAVRAARLMAVGMVLGAAALLVLAELLLAVFGEVYADHGVITLRWFAVGALAVAAAHWAVIVLRLRRALVATVVVAGTCAGVTVVLAALWAERGTSWVALGWAIGHLVGALLGLALVRRGHRPEGTHP